MLKQRIITAVLLLPLVGCLLFLPDLLTFSAILVPVFAILAWEWSRLLQAGKAAQTVFIILSLAAIGGVFYQLYEQSFFSESALPSLWYDAYPFKLLLVALMLWIVASIVVVLYPKATRSMFRGPWLRGLFGIIILASAWLAIVIIRSLLINLDYNFGAWMLLLMLVIIWGADVGAYFAGKTLGKTKLAPVVSPNKTWEGAIGGLILAIIVGSLVASLLPLTLDWLQFVVFIVLMVVLSVFGDLFESMLKRQANIKDSSNILPGHGGLLDRLDSTLSVAPFFVAGVLWLELLT